MKGRRDFSQYETEIARDGCTCCNNARVGNSEGATLIVELQNDHDAIRKETDVLQTSTKQLKIERNPEFMHHLSHLEQLFTQHSLKEEHALFPLLCSYLDSSVCEGMRLEHEEISNLIREVQHQTGHDQKSSILRLNRLLRTHFSREENVLFWYLNIRLSGEEKIEENYHSSFSYHD